MSRWDTLILALNPRIDAEWRVDDVLWEEKNHVHSEGRWASGKGINAARWLKHRGGKTSDELAGYRREEKFLAHITRLREPTRVNVIVTTHAGRQTRLNPLGPQVSLREWGEVLNSERGTCSMRLAEQKEFGWLVARSQL